MGGLALRNAARTSPVCFLDQLCRLPPNGSETTPRSGHPHRGDVEQPPKHAVFGGRCPSTRRAARPSRIHTSKLARIGSGATPPPREPEENEPGTSRTGWQHEASSRTERQHRKRLFTTMSDSERAMVRSQSGPGVGVPFTVCPTGFETRTQPLFRTLLLRRLRLPLSMSKRICRCGRPLDSRGHHRAACARAGVLGR